MFKLKQLHKDAIVNAIAKAERYRFLNDAVAAESICRDILLIDPENEQALTMLILTITDQFAKGGLHNAVGIARGLIPGLKNEYQRIYYTGIICERWAKAQLRGATLGSSGIAYESLREAMHHYEKAEKIHAAGNDDAILRWNACVRTIENYKLSSHEHDNDRHEPYFE